jgi:RHS repeat-associated protein
MPKRALRFCRERTNRQSQSPSGGGTLNYPPGNNRISTFKYDASGNVLDDVSNQYVYDGEGRVCVVYNRTLQSYTGYVYDGLGNRVAKGTPASSLSCDNNFTPASSFIVGLNGEQLDELNGSGAQYSNVFAGGHLLATYQFATPGWSYTLNDWLGTKRVVANASGVAIENCHNLPFGDSLNCTGPGGDPSPQHFTGQVHDQESNNDYFVARYYSEYTGRFMSPDWSEEQEPVPYADLFNPQSLNLYGYVNNNPLSRVDKDGHATLCGPDQPYTDANGNFGVQAGQCVTLPDPPTQRQIVRQWVYQHTTTAPPNQHVPEMTSKNTNPWDPLSLLYGMGSLITPERLNHILNGDATGGGHAPGTGIPGKTEFPSDWSNDKIESVIEDVATDPNSTRVTQGRTEVVTGTREGVDVKVVIRNGEIVTAHPTNLPRNP